MKKQTDRSGTGPTPLGLALAQFARRLEARGYTKGTRRQYLAIARKFDRYAASIGIELPSLREDHVERFLVAATAGRELREGGRFTRRFWRKVLSLLFEQLRAVGLVPPADVGPEVLGPGLAEYVAFLREHRGLRASTVRRQRRHVADFLAEIQAGTEDDLRRIAIEQIDRHLVQASRRLARESIGSLSSSLRGFLGYLFMRGTLPTDIRAHVATPHIYPLEGMPRAAGWSDIQRTLATVDRSTTLGCRDYAMLTLIAYCGLRAGDAAALRLQDLDWRHDVIHARRPKGGTSEDVPLVPVVGEALIAYLRQRPATPHDEVFLTVKAPVRPLPSARISARASKYLTCAGVKVARLGAHTLRHSFAVELQRQGHSLKEIGEALGHSHPQSTFIYAKANVERLREAALDIQGVLP